MWQAGLEAVQCAICYHSSPHHACRVIRAYIRKSWILNTTSAQPDGHNMIWLYFLMCAKSCALFSRISTLPLMMPCCKCPLTIAQLATPNAFRVSEILTVDGILRWLSADHIGQMPGIRLIYNVQKIPIIFAYNIPNGIEILRPGSLTMSRRMCAQCLIYTVTLNRVGPHDWLIPTDLRMR